MPNTFRVNPGVTDLVAAMIAPHIQRLGQEVADACGEAAPRVKVWKTMEDERVRPWHRKAHGQAVPDNLRFELPQAPYQGNQHPTGHDYLRFPRDPEAGRLQTEACRCSLDYNEDLANSIHAEPVRIEGHKVSCRVVTDYNRAKESNDGTVDDPPAAFMEKGLADVASRQA